jgi:hypothetical protein
VLEMELEAFHSFTRPWSCLMYHYTHYPTSHFEKGLRISASLTNNPHFEATTAQSLLRRLRTGGFLAGAG